MAHKHISDWLTQLQVCSEAYHLGRRLDDGIQRCTSITMTSVYNQRLVVYPRLSG